MLKNKISNILGIILLAFALGYVLRYYTLCYISTIQTEYYEIILFTGILLSFVFLAFLLFFNMTKISKFLVSLSLLIILLEKLLFLSSKALMVLPLDEITDQKVTGKNELRSKNLIYSDWNIKEVGFTNTTIIHTENFEDLTTSYSSYCFYVELSDDFYLVFWRHSDLFQ